MSGSKPTAAWYNEISLYNYKSPGFSAATGHFTQVVWAGSTQLGIGIAFTSNNLAAYVVANYFPPGNYLGQFPANVLPRCATSINNSAVGMTEQYPNLSASFVEFSLVLCLFLY
ncbi:unnamed protein product [Rotaria socialis]|uniref:SCP domain-containing protein n=1 Tax=Rotaria socialis TaxID=392032 RepID=A0A817Y294_9BILA|nr:unnamed protein product [Rotaria socialis]CAF3375238.1 unnamed protein product [Rotaria socialis]CAF3457208.1 unnamed protein product [Rotaria socialis]CAF3640131.1 unnamed protein product [Rotaria socialis]CAF4220169.1 unnamed protein product [Rotaria socialis]